MPTAMKTPKPSRVIEFKRCPFELKDLTEAGQFKGYASTWAKDQGGDTIQEGAFKRTLEQNGQSFPVLWFHDPRQPVGISTVLKEDGHGLYTEGQLNLEKQIGQDCYSDMKLGIVGHMSIGYSAVQSDYDSETNSRLIKEIKLYEYSLLTKGFAMQPEAVITDVKSINGLLHAPLVMHAMLKVMLQRAIEGKAGAVLSKVNIQRIQDAIESLEAVLTAAGVDPEADDPGKSHSDAITGLSENVAHHDTEEIHSLMREFLQMAEVKAMFADAKLS